MTARDTPRPTGIRAREHLPSRSYDHLFELRLGHGGETLCVMRPGTRAFDKHWWEIVPPDPPGAREATE